MEITITYCNKAKEFGMQSGATSMHLTDKKALVWWRNERSEYEWSASAKKAIAFVFTNEDAKGARHELKLSQAALAHALGIARETVVRRETGLLTVPRESVLALQYLLAKQKVWNMPWRDRA